MTEIDRLQTGARQNKLRGLRDSGTPPFIKLGLIFTGPGCNGSGKEMNANELPIWLVDRPSLFGDEACPNSSRKLLK
jgi:hypothetical protein